MGTPDLICRAKDVNRGTKIKMEPSGKLRAHRGGDISAGVAAEAGVGYFQSLYGVAVCAGSTSLNTFAAGCGELGSGRYRVA